jgi:hypothetical protein
MAPHEPDGTKRCRDCGENKPRSEFWQRRASRDGLALYCVPCFRERNADAQSRKAAAEGRVVRRHEARHMVVPEGMKYCPRCQEVLALDAFVRNRSDPSGIGAYCRPCQNAKVAESIARNHGNNRHYHLMRRYGIGADDVLEMLRGQGWLCPICDCQLTLETAHVDHDHRTGQVRAVLCFNCNGGLGQFRDDPQVLRRAAAYLEGSEWQQTKPEPGAYPRPISLREAPLFQSSSEYTPPIFSLDGVLRLRPH